MQPEKKVVLREKFMDKLLYSPEHLARIKSVPTTNAQTVALCAARENLDPAIFVNENHKEQIRQALPKLYYLIAFMLSTGCRISEALSIRAIDITSNGHVKLNMPKQKTSRMVSAGMSTEYLITCRQKKVAPWSDWNRYFVYRLFKKYNIGIQLAGREKKSITHAIRHSVAKSIKNNGFTIENSKQVLGHNSLKGTSYYHE